MTKQSVNPVVLVGAGAVLAVLYFFTMSSMLLAIGLLGLVLYVASRSGWDSAGSWPFVTTGVPLPYWRLAGALAVLLLLLGLAAPVSFEAFFWDPVEAGAGGLSVILGVALSLAAAAAPLVAVRRFWSGLLLAVGPSVAFSVLADGHPVPMLAVVSVLACGLCATWTTRWAPWGAAVIALAAVLFPVWSGGSLVGPLGLDNTFIYHRDLEYLITTSVLFLVAFVFAGILGFAWRRGVARGEQGRAALARVNEVEEQSAVVEERARLARDLHDVVAHHVSLIAVRAETAPYSHADLGEPARAVLADIAADARLALDELRGVLGILGRSGEDAERAPQPTWSDISALVERSRAAGLDITLTGDVQASVPPGVGYAGYRVVQEALTNARKHAPGAPVTVDLGATDRLVHVTVRNPASETPSTGGRGLVGMKERVSALGGRMSAGVVTGEHVVDVTLPVMPS